jgi:hypothetical protein
MARMLPPLYVGTERTYAHLSRGLDQFDGEPWVSREPPVVSTDDRVTAAVVARD